MPVKTLGLPDDAMFDPWGGAFTYAVDQRLTATNAFTTYCPNSSSVGSITIQDGSGNNRIPTAGEPNVFAIAAVISHGPNGHGAYQLGGNRKAVGSNNADEQTNCHCDNTATANAYNATFVMHAANTTNFSDPTYTYDDTIRYYLRMNVLSNADKEGKTCITQKIWVADTFNNRVQEFDGSGTYLNQFGSGGTGNGQFGEPMGGAIDASGNIWVVDYANSRVQEFNSSGTYLNQFGSFGSGNGQFSLPEGVAIDASGNIWVADAANNRVQKFNSSGTFLLGIGAGYNGVGGVIGSSGSGNGQLWNPMGIAIDASSNTWVADDGNNRVQEFNSSGVYQSQFGSFGSGNGQLGNPLGIAIDASGNIWVADTANNRVQKFNSSGVYQSQFGSSGSGNGQFSGPYGIAIDASGNIWVLDHGNNRVEEFSSTGTYLNQFGSSGSGNGQLSFPGGIVIH